MKPVQLLLILVFLTIQCCNPKNNTNPKVQKNDVEDPFANTMVKSEYFKVNSEEDKIIVSSSGIQIFIPKNAFVNENGENIEKDIDIEFAEASDVDDMILSNLVMQEPGKIIRQEQVFFFNATQNGKQLRINPQHPVFIEIPSEKPIKLYHGIRNQEGEMNWTGTVNPVQYLIPVPLKMLDFLPSGFKAEVEKGLPFHGHKIITDNLADSLYYSFGGSELALLEKLVPTNMKMINLIAPVQYIFKQAISYESDTTMLIDFTYRGINPASIKAIRTRKFENTLISTREFETRLKSIFLTCNNEVLELYVNNLNKNLWEIDSLVAAKLGKDHPAYNTFMDYAALKQTTVKLSDKKAAFLAQHFYQQREKIEQKLNSLREELLDKVEKHENIVRNKQEEYRGLLEERHKYRMNKFGFELTQTGWYNAAEKITLEEVKKFEMITTVSNGNSFDRVYVYVVNSKIKSIFSLLAEDMVNFNQVFQEDPDLLLWENQKFHVVGVGFQNNMLSYKIEEHIQQPKTVVTLNLLKGDQKQFKNDLKPFTKNYSKENKILVDLEYQAFFYEEQQRIEKEVNENNFEYSLLQLAFPCLEMY